jgi:branched-subunit amino acid aminotransferase/4-amino-4-deoxychorismate lyase
MMSSESSLPLPRQQQQQDERYYSVLVKNRNVVTTKFSEEKPSMDTLIDGFYNLSNNNNNDKNEEKQKQKQARYDYNNCAYTCARTTCERTHIFQYELHVKRLIDSTRAALMTTFGQQKEKEKEKTTIEIKSLLDQLHDMIKLNCALAMKTFSTKFENQMRMREGDHELKLTLAVVVVVAAVNDIVDKTTSIRRSLDFYCHAGLLPTTDNAVTITGGGNNNNINKKIIRVLIGGTKRDNSTIKDANWVKQRKELFREQINHIVMNHHVDGGLYSTTVQEENQQKIEDIILLDNNNSKDNDNDNDVNNPTLLEGTETNFFAVDIDGNVLTADHDVLKGTVRASVLNCCKMNDIPVKFQPIKLNTLLLNNDDADDHHHQQQQQQQQQENQQDRRFIQGAFLTSTSRLVLPIHQIIIPSRYRHPVTAACPSEEETTIKTYNFQNISPIILRIKTLVEEDMKRNSVKII